ncbi:MAG: hypothetical protein ACSHXI_20595 [Hoeflea sp.]|uniref:hypothetical protein n=1 Tax=Hoeflea sp. TaxID=1940281 RepID=UPI003EF9E04B
MNPQNSNVVSLPNLKRDSSIQLDLFDFFDARSRSYNFANIATLDQEKLFYCIDKYGFRAILDMRKFPSFDRPLFDHRAVLKRFDNAGVFYFPAVFTLHQDIKYHELQKYKTRLQSHWSRGPLLLICGERDTGREYLDGLRKLIEKRFVDKVEMIPRVISR